MSAIRIDLISATISRAHATTDVNIYNNIHRQFEFRKQFVLADKSLTNVEKTVAVRRLNHDYDRFKIIYNKGTKRICENCSQSCLATLYCEYCIRNYLKARFSNWTSGNSYIDDLIRECQTNAFMPTMIVEWIPYNSLKNIKYLTKGGFSEIYTADWIDGYYQEWDSEEQQLRRRGTRQMILKSLGNAGNANQNWFEEAKSHLVISNKWADISQCYGLTQDPLNENYMLVMEKHDIDLRKYLQQNHHQLTWKERIRITYEITRALYFVHKENMIHKDLHSGNVLYSRLCSTWHISDLGFCGPADKSSESIYGNLPYIAPEVISGREYTYKSDTYSIAMLMWEISSGQPPFVNYAHDYNLAINIINGIRPKIVSEIPLEYKRLMEQCWDADPLKRPNLRTLCSKIREINLHYQNVTGIPHNNKNVTMNGTSSSRIGYTNSRLFTSKIYNFENLPKPKNATEEELEAFHSKLHDFCIPDYVDSKQLSKEFEVKDDDQMDFERETTRNK